MSDEIPLISVKNFMTQKFMELLKIDVDRYIKLRTIGRSSIAALRTAFGEEYIASGKARAYIDRIECSSYYIRNFPVALEQVKLDQIWSPKIAAAALASVAADQDAKCSSRVAAMKELNAIFGITVVDESGKVLPGRAFTDFYAKEAAKPQRHPEPGTPEAEAYTEEIATRH